MGARTNFWSRSNDSTSQSEMLEQKWRQRWIFSNYKLPQKLPGKILLPSSAEPNGTSAIDLTGARISSIHIDHLCLGQECVLTKSGEAGFRVQLLHLRTPRARLYLCKRLVGLQPLRRNFGLQGQGAFSLCIYFSQRLYVQYSLILFCTVFPMEHIISTHSCGW